MTQDFSEIRSSNSEIFESFAEYYDLIYRDKDYKHDVDFLLSLLKAYKSDASQILDLGCGTAAHDLLLAERGFLLTGLDRSAAMIHIANQKSKFANLSHPPHFKIGDMKKFNLDRQFDAVISLFSSINYLIGETDLNSLFNCVRAHLPKGGILILDSWNAASVEKSDLTPRTKVVETSEFELIRTSTLAHDSAAKIVSILYRLNIDSKSSETSKELCERHTVRYFSSDELLKKAKENSLICLETGSWGERRTAHDTDWNLYWVFEAR